MLTMPTPAVLRACAQAEKVLEKAARKAQRPKRMPDGTEGAEVAQAQQHVADRIADLEALRWHSLRQVLTEERRRHVILMDGILETLKVQKAYFNQSRVPLNNCLASCVPLVQVRANSDHTVAPRVAVQLPCA